MFGSKTPFGGGGFGSSTSAFGTQQSSPFGGTSGGLFGSKTPAAGTFGTPTFGSATPSSGGLFGGTTGTGLFGTKTTQSSGFGSFGTSTGTSGGLFGSSGTSLFQSPQTSNAFGAKTSGFGGFGTSNNAFGSTTTSTGGLFGAGSSVFGGGTQQAGTNVKFAPVVSQEQTQKSGVSMTVKTQNQCITVMDVYKTKCLEELRLEDYAAGRKGGSTSAFGSGTTGGLFGNTSSSGSSLFGSTTSKPSAFGGFGSTANTGSLFGQASTGGGLFGAKTTQSIFGGTTTTTASGFGGFGSTGGGLFGNTSSTGGGLFTNTSTQQNSIFGGTSGFGSTAGTSTGGLFGGTFGQTQSTQSGGLFGSTKPAFGGFGTSTGTGFGTTNNSLFGNTASSGGLFGITTSKPGFSFGGGTTGFGTATSGFGGFGATSSSGSLFGNTSTGGLFGNKTTGFGSTGFGTTSNTGGSLFGNTGFGGGATTGFGGLGSANTGLSIGGNALSGLSKIDQSTLTAFQQQQMIQKQLKAIANTPFGDSALFRNLPDLNTEKSSSSNISHTASPDPLHTSQYKVLSRPVAKVKPRPVGLSSPSLGKSRLFEGLGNDGDFSPYSLKEHSNVKKLVIKEKSKQVAEPFSEGEINLRLQQRDMNHVEGLVSPSPNVMKTKSLDQNNVLDVDSPNSGKLFDNAKQSSYGNIKTPMSTKTQNYVITPETSDKKFIVNSNAKSNSDPGDDDELPACKVVLTRPEYFTEPTIGRLDELVSENRCIVHDFIVGREGYGEVKFLGKTDVYGLNLDDIVTFRRREVEVYPDDYENKPEVGDELNKPSEITLLKVWPNDKSNHTPVKSPQRLKSSGFIENLEEKTLAMAAVFIDYRPKEGAWVFKVNHFTRYGIQDQYISDSVIESKKSLLMKSIQEEGMDDWNNSINDNIDFYKEKISPSLKKHVRKTIEKVIDEKIENAKVDISLADPESDILIEDNKIDDDGDTTFDISRSGKTEDDKEATNDIVISDDLNIEEEELGHGASLDEEFLPISHQIGQISHVGPFNVQGMKTSFLFDEDEYEDKLTPKAFKEEKRKFSDKSIFSSTYMKLNEKEQVSSPFPKLDLSLSKGTSKEQQLNSNLFKNIAVVENPSKVAKKMNMSKSLLNKVADAANETSILPPPSIFFKCKSLDMVPYESSLVFGKQSCFADASLQHGRQFRTSWFKKLEFIHTGSPVGKGCDSRSVNASILEPSFAPLVARFGLSKNFVNKEQLVVDCNPVKKQFIENFLAIYLKHTSFKTNSTSILDSPVLDSGVNAISEYTKLVETFINLSADGLDEHFFETNSEVWNLIKALWGKQDADDEITSLYEIHSTRRNLVSEWLSKCLARSGQKDIAKTKLEDDGHLALIFSLLSAKQIRKACHVARINKETRLAFLIAQTSGDYHLKHYIRSQLSQWEERQIDEFMNPNRLKIYVLLSGMMVWKSSKNHINLCEGVDWKRAFALHLWFYCSKTTPLYDAFIEYQNSFKGAESYEPYSCHPQPTYYTRNMKNEENSSHQQTKDICYHLLALYCKRSHSLCKMLTPKTYTEHPLDVHLSWHVYHVLEQIGYTHSKDDRHAFLQQSYATQLESIGLWHWSAFVLMHLKDQDSREYCVKELLNRHCRVNDELDNIDFTKEEQKIIEEFHVPKQWVHQAKALNANYSGRHYEQALHLIRADMWNEAHIVIMEHIAVDAIIEDEIDLLKNLLSDINQPERSCTVKNWKIGGQIFLDYILLKEKLENIQDNRATFTNYHLEDMETEVSSMINRIRIIKAETAREKLCQSEMARTCSNILKIVFSLMNMVDNKHFEEDELANWSSAKIVPYVSDLPLPPDYYQRELREVLANYMDELNADGR